MIRKVIGFSNSNKLEKFICYGSYLGLTGFIIFISMRIMNNKNEEKMIYEHSKNASMIFLAILFSIPFAKAVNRMYFYLLDVQLNILLIIAYGFCLFKFMRGLKSVHNNELPKRFILI